MRMKAKRPKFLQNVQAHIDISDIILNTIDFEDHEVTENRLGNRLSNIVANKTDYKANSDLEMRLSSFTMNHHSMPTNNNMGNPNSTNGISNLS